MNDDTSLDEVLTVMRETYKQIETDYDNSAEDFWNNLSNEEQLLAFYSVAKRIHRGEIEDSGSYRYVLYDVFGFGAESYGIGMMCGYMNIHNSIYSGQQKENEDLPNK